MTDDERFQLRFGPYAMSKLRVGEVVTDEARGDVKVVRIADAPIQWPVGTRIDSHGGSSLVLFADLCEAVRNESNQAVAHWWSVSPQTVTKWRNALSVSQNNAGTLAIRQGYAQEDWFKDAQKNAVKKARDPVRREKIAASKRGKKRPRHVIEALRQASLGRTVSEETRHRIGETLRRRGVIPPAAGVPWTADEDALLRTLPPEQVAQRTGRTQSAVSSRRAKLGLPDRRKESGEARQMVLFGRCLDLLREMQRKRAEGLSFQKISDWLNDEGHVTGRRQKWDHNHVRVILRWFESQRTDSPSGLGG